MSGGRLRVLQVIPRLIHGGGAEQSLVALAPGLIAAGIELHVAYLQETSDLEAVLQRAGVVTHDLTGPGGALVQARRVRALVQRINPAVVHSSLHDADLVCRLGLIDARRSDRPVLMTTWANTSYDPDRYRFEPGPPRWKLEVVRGLDAVLGATVGSWYHAVTSGVATSNSAPLHAARRRVRVVERGRDLTKFRPASAEQRALVRAELGLDGSTFALMCVGREFAQKAHPVLLQAFDALADRHPDVRLILVGPRGPGSSAVDAALAAMRHADRVDRLGERSDVDRLLAAADLFVLASIVEGAAGSVLEAMACGIPVVATRVAGFEGWLDDGVHALLATPGDPESLAAVLERAVTDRPALAARAAAGAALVADRFSIERSTAQMAALYRSVVGQSTTLRLVRQGRFSGTTPSLVAALARRGCQVDELDVATLTRHPLALVARSLAHVEGVRTGAPWYRTRWWARYYGWAVGRDRQPTLFVQTMATTDPLPAGPYWVFTDRVASESERDDPRWATRRSPGWTQAEAAFLRGAKGVFVMGPTSVGPLAELGVPEDRVTVTWSGPNTPGIELVDRTARQLRNLLFIGRDWERKGGPDLVAAIEEYNRTTSQPLSLTVIGCRPPAPDWVRVLGEVQGADLIGALNEADVFALPTHSEAFGVVFVEAILAGLPILASDVSNVPAIVGDAGRCVPPGQSEALAEALQELVVDYPTFAAAAVMRAQEHGSTWSWDHIAATMIEAVKGTP